MEAGDSWATSEETTLSGGRIGGQVLWVKHVTVNLFMCQLPFLGHRARVRWQQMLSSMAISHWPDWAR